MGEPTDPTKATMRAIRRPPTDSGYDPQACGACMEYYRDNPALVGAAASVGIEHGKSTADMLHTVLSVYHRRGHPADLGAAIRYRDKGACADG
jgi:hypothetical protein